MLTKHISVSASQIHVFEKALVSKLPDDPGDTVEKNEFFQQQRGREMNVLIRRTKKTHVHQSVTGLVGRIYFFLIKKVKK